MTLTAEPDLLLEYDLELDQPPACEGEYHPTSQGGHNASSPGAWYIISPCCRRSILQCDGRVKYFRTTGLLTCTACDIEHLFEKWTVVHI